MTLVNVFRTSLYALVSLAAVMLAYGEESLFPSGITVVLAMFQLLFADRKSRFVISPLVANFLGLVALGAAGIEFVGDKQDARLLAGAHFLVYITWIVLLQAKGIRQYWWLSALSLLQVALGSVLTPQTGTYGLILLAYLPLALWTLSVFTLYQGAHEMGGLEDENVALRPAVAEAAGGAAFSSANPASKLLSRFSLERRGLVHNAIQQDQPGRWIVPRFVMGVFGLTVAGLGLGMMIFLFVPRVSFGGARFLSESSRGQAVTGYSSTIQLGQVGQILESIDRVMRVRLFERFDSQNERFMAIEEFTAEWGLTDPLFRGAVVDTYYGGGWASSDTDNVGLQQMSSHPLEPGIIRQEYSVELRGVENLFAMRPVNLARMDNPAGPINHSINTGVLTGSLERRDPIEYLVYSRRRTPANKVAGRNQFGNLPGRRNLSAYEQLNYLRLPDTGLERLVTLARRLTESEVLAGDDRMSLALRKAMTLESYLRDSGEYSYSLNMEVDNPLRDPVDEFVIDRKKGHCEYFGSALALMLRAAKIPSRLVVGFKGADFHPGSTPENGYYEVQQRHGHVWVEAYVDDEWIVLDATPGARDDVVREVASKAGFWKNAKNSISDLWSTYVVSLSLDRQQNSLYDPLTGKVSTGWLSLRDVMQQAASAVNLLRDTLTSPEQYFSRVRTYWLLGGIAIFAITARYWRRLTARLLTGGHATNRMGFFFRAINWIFARLTWDKVSARAAGIVFYERFLKLAQRAGFSLREGQTQREFADEVERALKDRLVQFDLADFPRHLAELFYRVRFGSVVLQPDETADLDLRLKRMDELLNGQLTNKPV